MGAREWSMVLLVAHVSRLFTVEACAAARRCPAPGMRFGTRTGPRKPRRLSQCARTAVKHGPHLGADECQSDRGGGERGRQRMPYTHNLMSVITQDHREVEALSTPP